MDHEFVVIDGININATHLLGLKHEQAVKELLANDQVPGKDDAEKTKWISDALGKAKTELDTRAADRKKKADELAKKAQEPSATTAAVVTNPNSQTGTTSTPAK